MKKISEIANDILPDHGGSGSRPGGNSCLFSAASSSATEGRGIRGCKNKAASSGLTLVELLVVMGVFAILSPFVTMNVMGARTQASEDSAVILLVSDLKQQQIKAMGGSNGGNYTASSSGVYFGSTGYTLFTGSSYSGNNGSNFVVNLESGLRFTNVTFPSSVVVFASGSGEVVGYSPNASTAGIAQANSGRIKTITINRYGVVTTVK